MSRINKAFRAIDRSNFLPDSAHGMADVDAPLPIGFGQTNSQPTTVNYMLEWLDPQPGDKMLDVGSGSGWTTALLAYLVRPSGLVYAVERVDELVEFGADNFERTSQRNARFFKAGKTLGLPKHAPYDKILVSAAADELPAGLVAQLKLGGRMVIPIKNSVWVIDKVSNHDIETIEHPGFAFVPLV